MTSISLFFNFMNELSFLPIYVHVWHNWSDGTLENNNIRNSENISPF